MYKVNYEQLKTSGACEMGLKRFWRNSGSATEAFRRRWLGKEATLKELIKSNTESDIIWFIHKSILISPRDGGITHVSYGDVLKTHKILMDFKDKITQKDKLIGIDSMLASDFVNSCLELAERQLRNRINVNYMMDKFIELYYMFTTYYSIDDINILMHFETALDQLSGECDE